MRGSILLSIGPRVLSGPDWLLATSSLPAAVLTLFSHRRYLTIDGRSRTIVIRRRLLWFVRRERSVAFTDVKNILYELDDLNVWTMIGMTGDTFDCYKVGLRLQDASELHLFSFLGAGTFQRGWDSAPWMPDWFFAVESTFDMSGAQSIQSSQFIEKLQELLNVPLGRGTA